MISVNVYEAKTHLSRLLAKVESGDQIIISRAIRNRENQLYFSAASSWKIAIKYRLCKLPLPMNPSEYVISRMNSCGFSHLSINHPMAGSGTDPMGRRNAARYSVSTRPLKNSPNHSRCSRRSVNNTGLRLFDYGPGTTNTPSMKLNALIFQFLNQKIHIALKQFSGHTYNTRRGK